MTPEIIAAFNRQNVPPLYSQENTGDPQVYLKITVPDSSWRWFVTEGEADADGGDILLFGYVSGFELEKGYFRLSEIWSIGRPVTIRIYTRPLPFSKIKVMEKL